MLVGIVPFLLAFGGPNLGKRPLLRQVTPRMLLADVSELTNMPHVAASAVSAFAAPSMLLSGSTTSPEVAADVTGLFSLAGFSAPEVAVISTLGTAFAAALTFTTSATNKKLDTLDNKLDTIDAKLNMFTAPVAAIGTIVGIVVLVAVVAAGVSLEKSAVTVFARAQVPVSRESAPLQVEAPSTSTTIAVASPFPARG
jgi:hypothetical protein